MATRNAISETKKTKTVKKTGEETVNETPVTDSQEETVKPETEKAEPAEKPVKAAAKPVEAVAEKEETKAPEKKTPEKKTSTRTAAKKTTTKKEAAPKKETTTKKTTTKKETAVKKTASKKEMKVNAIVEHYGRQISEQDIIAHVKRAWTNSGKNEKDIKSIELYIKPEENAVYYVVNETETGAVALYE